MNISFRKYDFKLSEKNESVHIFDEVRKKNVILTPEEWVRQNFIHYLIYDLAYPRNKIAVEKEFKINGLKKRFDLLVFDQSLNPFLLMECKSQKENLNKQVLHQCLNYNLNYGASFLFISNGDFTHGWELKEGKALPIDQFPKYPEYHA